MKSDVSVIVPSYNGRKKLPGLLAALEKQTISSFELVILIDGSSDDSEEFLQNYQPKNFRLVVHRQENSGRAAVRNRGAEIALFDLLVYYDDDMRPESQSIEKHLEFHQNYDSSICGGNQIENREKAKSDFDRYRCDLREKWLAPFKNLTKLHPDNVYLTAANFSIPKQIFSKLEGFNNDLKDHEDRELAQRALNENIALYFDPNNIAWHDDFVPVTFYIKRRRQYTKEFQKQGQIQTSGLFSQLLYSFFSRPYWVRAIEKETLTFIPKSIRYRIYDLVVWGLGTHLTNRPLIQ